jgi:capsular polysaccharide transport system ATP-binding protein
MIKVINLCKDYPIEGGLHRALNDVSFEVMPGEKIAVLGRNGAGKSTLIRLLSGIEYPTSGRIERTMSISWPVGLTGGLHPVMTGNDNIRFVARVYGKPFKELRDFVDDFARLGHFLSEPLYSYSSGMGARLNFALSLGVDFDCYLIDEILAVGDQRFQARSYEELFDKRRNCAMILASHSREVIVEFCSKALVLHRGRGKIFENINLALDIYDSL